MPVILSTTGPYRDRLQALYTELGFLDLDLSNLRSRFWVVRMRALRNLSVVATPEHRDRLLEMRRDHPSIRILAAQIIARVGSADDVVGILESWRIARRLHAHPVRMLVDSMPIEELRRLMAHWERFEDDDIRKILLDATATRDPGAVAPYVSSAVQDPNMEVRIGAARALSRLPADESIMLLRDLLGDEQWPVRNAAAQSLGALRTERAIEPLRSALGDRQYWVRHNAAKALAGLGDSGVETLRRVAAHDEDRYARDAAAEFLGGLATAGATA